MPNETPEDLARQEIEEIEWVAGLIDMPQHLIDRGTVVRRYTHEVRLLKLPECRVWEEGDVPQMTVEGVDYEIAPIEPRTEVWVWGERVV